jgi:hypothetical protein
VFLFLGLAGNLSCFSTGFSDLIHISLTEIALEERSTHTRSNFIDRQLTPAKYLDTEEPRTPWNTCTAVRSPYIRGQLTYKTEFKEGSVSFSGSHTL